LKLWRNLRGFSIKKLTLDPVYSYFRPLPFFQAVPIV
jgi:hypothetical protein